MSIWLLTYQQSVLSQWQTFLGLFTYKMAAKKSSGIDMEQNYVTVTYV